MDHISTKSNSSREDYQLNYYLVAVGNRIVLIKIDLWRSDAGITQVLNFSTVCPHRLVSA